MGIQLNKLHVLSIFSLISLFFYIIFSSFFAHIIKHSFKWYEMQSFFLLNELPFNHQN